MSFPSLMLETGLNHIETGESNDCPSLRLKAGGSLWKWWLASKCQTLSAGAVPACKNNNISTKETRG